MRWRKQNLLLALALILAVGGHALAQLSWIRLDRSVGASVFCDMILPVIRLLQAQVQGELEATFWRMDPGWIAWPALLVRSLLGSHHDFMLWTVLIFMVATQLLLFEVGRLLERPWIGVAMAALFPLYPDVGMMLRRWAPMVPHFFFLTAALVCLLRSRSFSRPLASFGYGSLVAVGFMISSMMTDNLLFMAAAGAMGLGALSRGLVQGKGVFDEPAFPRWRPLLGCLAAAFPIVVLVGYYFYRFPSLAYFQNEMYASAYQRYPWNSWPAITAYWRNLQVSSVGRVYFSAFLLALPLFVWKGRARAELITWSFLPLLLLSLIGKKNSYYVSVIYPTLPLITGLGLAALPRRWIQASALLGLLAYGSTLWFVRSFPVQAGPRWHRFAHYEALGDKDQAFQTVMRPDLEPVMRFRHAREVQLIGPHLTAASCPGQNVITFLNQDDYTDAWLLFLTKDPCVQVRTWPDVDFIPQSHFILVADPRCKPQPPPGWISPPMGEPPKEAPAWQAVEAQLLQEGVLEVVGQDLRERPCFTLYARKDWQGPWLPPPPPR